MSEQNDISINIIGSKLDNTQTAATKEGNITQVKQNSSKIDEPDIIAELDKIKDLIHQCKLSDLEKNIALRDLNKAKQEAEKEMPRKDFVSEYLKNSLEVLVAANKNIDEGSKFIHTAKSIVQGILPWLGVSLSFLGL